MSNFYPLLVQSLIIAEEETISLDNLNFPHIHMNKVQISLISDNIDTELKMQRISYLHNLLILKLKKFLNIKWHHF